MFSFPESYVLIECPNVNVSFVGLWVYKDFEGFNKYRGQVIGHDVDMLDNVTYNVT